MPFVLRKIRKAKWYKSSDVPWLLDSDLQADALGDLVTKGNRLSVYLIDDDQANLPQVVAALAASGQYVSDFEYALFDFAALLEFDIEVERAEGNTPDDLVNDWHRELVRLSVQKITALATLIQGRAERRRFLSKQVFKLISQGIAAGNIDRTKLKPSLTNQIDSVARSEESIQ